MTKDNLSYTEKELTPDERIKARYPAYAGLIDILIYEFDYNREILMTVLGYSENRLNDMNISFTLPDLLRLVNRAKVELK